MGVKLLKGGKGEPCATREKGVLRGTNEGVLGDTRDLNESRDDLLDKESEDEDDEFILDDYYDDGWDMDKDKVDKERKEKGLVKDPQG